MSRFLVVPLFTAAALAIVGCQSSENTSAGGSVSPAVPADTSCEATVGAPGQQQSGYYSAPGCPDISVPPSQR